LGGCGAQWRQEQAMTLLGKTETIGKYARHETDVGSPEVQIALLTGRITELSDHFKNHPKDFHSKRGLLSLVARRRGLLKFLMANNRERYKTLISELGLRK
jgi:small subunit ribosomal protein S15